LLIFNNLNCYDHERQQRGEGGLLDFHTWYR